MVCDCGQLTAHVDTLPGRGTAEAVGWDCKTRTERGARDPPIASGEREGDERVCEELPQSSRLPCSCIQLRKVDSLSAPR